jgi:hypothetical protein
MMMNNNLNINLGSMVSLNSIYNKYRITPGEFPLSNNQDLTRIATAMTRCSGGDGGVDGGDDDDDDGDDVPLDDDGDGVDFPLREGISPADSCPPESSFLSGVLRPAEAAVTLREDPSVA